MRPEEIKEGRIYLGVSGKLRYVHEVGLATEVPGIGVFWSEYDSMNDKVLDKCGTCLLSSFAKWAKRRYRE